MKNVFSYNPKYQYDYDFSDIVVDELIKMNYKAKSDMGISQMKILSNASRQEVKIVLLKAEEIFFKEEKWELQPTLTTWILGVLM